MRNPGYVQGQLSSDKKSWSGIIGLLLNQTVDVAIGPIIPTESSRNVISYSMPFMTSKVSVLRYIMPRNNEFNIFPMDLYLETFDWKTWTLLGFAVLVMSILLTCLDWITPSQTPFNILRSIYFISAKAVFGMLFSIT